MYSKVTQKVRINGKLGEAFQTFYGVKQGDPLSTDLFGIMIEILDEMLQLACPHLELGSKLELNVFMVNTILTISVL